MLKAKSSHYLNELPHGDIVTIDDILIYLGEFGLYQKALFCMVFFFCTFLVFVYFTQIFLTVVPTEHWCKLPHVDGVTTEKLRSLMIPSSERVPYEGHELPYSRCWMYDLPLKQILDSQQPSENWPLKKCSDWDFKYTNEDVPYSSIATEQNWVCDDMYKATLAQSIFFIGSIFGGLIFGRLSDKRGRIVVLIGTNMMGFIGGVSTIFINSFWQFCVCRFIVGFAYDNTFTIAYILVLEYVGPSWRTFAANMSYGLFFTSSSMALPWIAYGIANWRILALATSVPLASTIFTPFIVPESIRWLISKGKIEKAVKIMTVVERVNKRDVPQDVYEEFLDDCMETAENTVMKETTFIDLFRTKRLRRTTIILMISWSVITLAYDGHIRSLNSLGMNVFKTFTIASFTEFPAEILITFTLDIWGRRWYQFGAVLASGIFSFIAASCPTGYYYASSAMAARFFINIASNIALQYAAELFPTVIRGEGVAFIHTLGYAASILSPFVGFSSTIQYNLPMIILGTTSIICAIICLFLPETLNEQLPQTLLDGEMFGIKQKFWEGPFTRKRSALDLEGHHLNATQVYSRSALMRSSMVSGYLGNKRRVRELKKKVNRDGIRPRTSPLAIAKTPLEYVGILKEKYAEIRERQRQEASRLKPEGDEEQKVDDPNIKRTRFADERK